ADNGDVRQVLQELRGLVEERAVILVALDDEVAARSEPEASVEIRRDAADEHAWIGASRGQQPSGERRRRGLAVRARDDDRPRPPEKMLADRFGQREVP